MAYYRTIEGQPIKIDGDIWTTNIKSLFFDKVFGMLCAGLNENVISEALAEGAKLEIICGSKVYKPVRSEEWARIGHRIKKPSIKYPGTFWHIVTYPLEQYRHRTRHEQYVRQQGNLFQEEAK